MSTATPNDYLLEERRCRAELRRDKRLLFQEGIRLAWYIVWWVLALPWLIFVPAILLWVSVAQGSPHQALAIVSGEWRDLPLGVIAICVLVVTAFVLGLHPYRSVMADHFHRKMHDWSLMQTTRRNKL